VDEGRADSPPKTTKKDMKRIFRGQRKEANGVRQESRSKGFDPEELVKNVS